MDQDARLQAARQRMVQDQLIRRGIRSQPVLEAMLHVPRERFVQTLDPEEAYSDQALPIECGQTISQPYMVALMTEALSLSGKERVLEVGTGSGYQTAILARLAAEVVSLERHAELSVRAKQVLAELGCRNVELVVGDGTLGWPARAPYDRILVTAGAACVPQPLWEQLAEGGILVIPVDCGDGQILERITKRSGRAVREALTGCRFVPLVAGMPPVPDA
ncbi:MAG: protein-L-isoaspartate(D-aspartate) O-methyltransferase [Pirellulales bacterium]|nr:protein-L-isoaspartate(D-aspartate) O-methyltransferase [Pirellulales bacterium]